MLGIAINVFCGVEYFIPELELGGPGSESCPRYGIAPKQPIGAFPLLVHFVKSLTTGRYYLWRQNSWKTDGLTFFDLKSLVVSGGVYTLLTGRSLDA